MKDKPNIVKVNVEKQEWKGLVKRMAIQKHSEYLHNELEMGSSKLKVIKHEKFGRNEYLELNVVERARMELQIITKMLDFKANYKNDKAEMWKCEACGRETEQASSKLKVCLNRSALLFQVHFL